MSGLITAAVIAAGGAVAAGAMQNKASKKAANSLQNGVEYFDPIQPNDPLLQDWRRTALDANNYNFNQFGDYAMQAARINKFNQKQAKAGYRGMQPYFDQLQNQVGRNALSFSQGQLPADVVSSIGRAASSRGLQSGFGQGSMGGGAGSGIGNLNLRNLGLTSLNLSQFGTNLAMQANQQAANLTPSLFRPESLMVSPQQAIGYQQQQLNTQNEAARYWNQLQNEARLGNVAGQNRASQMATETRLAGELANTQAIAQAGNSVGGMMFQYALAKQQQDQGGGMGGSASMFGNTAPPTGGSVSGYGYRPQSGYYQLA